jgi:hypothetical protein
MTALALGDVHNFGAQVRRVSENYFFKPRSIFWEWLIHSPESEFRKALHRLIETSGSPLPWNFFPYLDFPDLTTLTYEGRMQSVPVLSPVPQSHDLQALEAFGGFTAFCSWMGIADMHSENLAAGLTFDNRFLIAPFDIEVIFSNVFEPPQTLLLPSPDSKLSRVGFTHLASVLSRVANPLLAAAACGSGYLSTLKVLASHSESLIDLLASDPRVQNAPIRTSFRKTRVYFEYLQQPYDPKWKGVPFADHEREQLVRGDVPYYFQTLADPSIRYFTDERRRNSRRVAPPVDRPLPHRLLKWDEFSESSLRVSVLTEEGLFMILSSLIPSNVMGNAQYRHFQLSAFPHQFKVSGASLSETIGPRSWDDHVAPLVK